MTAIWEKVKSQYAGNSTELSYWCKLFENLSYSSKEFYGIVHRNLQAREVPGLEARHVVMKESGPFSPERLYLQLRRERLVFEMCAAPFGNGFFVSSRLFDRRRSPRLSDYLLLAGFLFLCGLAAQTLQKDWVWSVIGVTGIMALIWTVMRLAAAGVVSWLDRVLSDLPVLGPIYDHFFHPDTYYRQDLNNSYDQVAHNAVMDAVDEMISRKGLKPLTAEERRPVIRDLRRK